MFLDQVRVVALVYPSLCVVEKYTITAIETFQRVFELTNNLNKEVRSQNTCTRVLS